jgi:hypothetical protein
MITLAFRSLALILSMAAHTRLVLSRKRVLTVLDDFAHRRPPTTPSRLAQSMYTN